MTDDPMEVIIARAFRAAGIHAVENVNGLDFHVPEWGVFVEVKRMHSPRIAGQMAREKNVIAVQGEEAVKQFARLVEDAEILRARRRAADRIVAAIQAEQD